MRRLLLLPALAAALWAQSTFTNPLLPSGPDPWMLYHSGIYYYMNTTGRNLTLWRTRDPVDLQHAEKKVVWQPPAAGPYSRDIWAPEIHYLRGKWYIYFAADAGTNKTHRLWAIENASSDPFEGEWTFKGKVADSSDKWAIDGSVFEVRGKLYLVWSGWEGDENGVQNIYIARLKNPWTVDGKRARISTPQYPWEKVGDLKDPPHVDVNEGPEALIHGGRIFLVYSASGCWTNAYALGMLSASANADLLNPNSWKKSPAPVFSSSPEAHAFGAGHNGFFHTPGGEDWIIYHANPESNQGCGNRRSPRAQPFTWNPDGTPNFGKPVPLGAELPRPH